MNTGKTGEYPFRNDNGERGSNQAQESPQVARSVPIEISKTYLHSTVAGGSNHGTLLRMHPPIAARTRDRMVSCIVSPHRYVDFGGMHCQREMISESRR